MITISASEVKKRGISVVDEILKKQKSVPIIHRSKIKYVILDKNVYDAISSDLEESILERVTRSEKDYKSGKYTEGNADELISDIIL